MSSLQGKYGNTQHPICLSPDAVITVFNPSDDSKNRDINAIFDTGAVMTCLPEQEIKQLGRLNYSSVNVRGLNNTIVERETYIVDIQLGDNRFRNIEVIATSKEYGLIGRDILNKKKVTFNAPEQIWVYG